MKCSGTRKSTIEIKYFKVWNKTLHEIALDIEKRYNSPLSSEDRKWQRLLHIQLEDGLEYRPNTLFYSEQFHPLQREIACVTLGEQWKMQANYLCLLGPA